MLIVRMFFGKKECIRHSLLNEPNVDFEDAKFMLVACCAFVNYLISKMPIFGIE